MPRVKKRALQRGSRAIAERSSSAGIDETLSAVANEETLGGQGGQGDQEAEEAEKRFEAREAPEFQDYDPDGWGDEGEMYAGLEDSMWADNAQNVHQYRASELLAALQEVESRGYQMPKRYTLASDPEEMADVLETARNHLARQSGVKISRRLLTGFVGVVEFMNHRYDPLGLKLDGFSDSVDVMSGEYDDVLGRIWMLYGPGADGEMNPVLELAMLLVIAGGAVHMTNIHVENAIEEQKKAKKIRKGREGREGREAPARRGDESGGVGGFGGILPDFSVMQQQAPEMKAFPDLPEPVLKSNPSLDTGLDEALAAAGAAGQKKKIVHSGGGKKKAKRGAKTRVRLASE